MELIIAAAIFFLILSLLVTGLFIFTKKETRSVSKSVGKFGGAQLTDEEIDLLYKRKLSNIRLLNDFLNLFPFLHRVNGFLQQTGLNLTVAILIFMTLASGVLSCFICLMLIGNIFLSALCGFFGALIPTLILKVVHKKRLKKFEALFPDALDLMQYSLRSGHSVMSGLKMVSDEMPEPVGPEFGRIVEEVNFGIGLETALHNFSQRIGSDEAKYFATSLIIQRETGGNLAELLNGVSIVIRKRFRFREKVRTLSAEGRFSGYFLILTPFLITGAMYITSPGYSDVLYEDPLGPYIIGGGLIFMAIGAYMIHKMVQIDL